jgi:hypothetical protein
MTSLKIYPNYLKLLRLLFTKKVITALHIAHDLEEGMKLHFP